MKTTKRTIPTTVLRIFFLNIFYIVLFPSLCLSVVHKITNNNYNNKNPSLHDGNIAWESNVDGDFEIYYWDGHNILQITNNDRDDTDPSTHSGAIVWDATFDVDYWDGNSTHVIGHGGRPSLYNGSITFDDFYQSYRAEGIYYWNGNSTEVVPGSDNDSRNSSLYNGTIAWESNIDGDSEIFYWDGATTHKITNNSDRDTDPVLYNGTIAWVKDWRDIYYWDGTSTHVISSDKGIAYGLSLYNGTIAWSAYDGIGTNIYYWNGETIRQITNDTADNRQPSLYNGTIAWTSNTDGSNDIYYWNEDLPIIVNAGDDQTVMAGAPVTLNGSGSSAPESTMVSWKWVLQHQKDSSLNRTATGKTTTVPNLSAGLYAVTLTVKDNNGETATDRMSLTVTPRPTIPSTYLLLLEKD